MCLRTSHERLGDAALGYPVLAKTAADFSLCLSLSRVASLRNELGMFSRNANLAVRGSFSRKANIHRHQVKQTTTNVKVPKLAVMLIVNRIVTLTELY